MQSKIGAALRHLEPLRQILFNRSELYLKSQFRELRWRFYAAFWKAVCSERGWDCEPLGRQCIRIHGLGKTTYVIGSYVQLDSAAVLSVASNKSLARQLLMEIDVPLPKHLDFDLSGLDSAQAFMQTCERAIVVKPCEGGGGAGVTTDVTSVSSLRRAVVKASTICSRIVAEEQVEGYDYRLLYLDGELVDVVQRRSPTVVGDGRHNIPKLIALENQRRLTDDKITALSALTHDANVAQFLRQQGHSPKYVPAADSVVPVKTPINQNSTRDNLRVGQDVHPFYQKLGHKIRSHINIKLLGVDVIAPTLAEAPNDCGGAVNEINGTPAFHHHELIAGQCGVSHVGPQVMEFVLGSHGA